MCLIKTKVQTKMKAMILKQVGGPEHLVLKELPVPVIKDNEVLVQVRAISINPVDTFVRSNEMALKNILRLNGNEENIILGWDISGVVTETGDAVKELKTGDEVFGMVNFAGYGKAYAEYVAAPEDHFALKPKNISHAEAAATDLAALTAWQALVTYGKIKKGDKILIHAAGGGVGHYAVQIAKHFGAYVIGTASTAKLDFVKKLGADECIDYTAGNFEDIVKDADIILDSIPGNHLMRSVEAAKPGGRVISIKANFEGDIEARANQKNLFTHRLMVRSNGEDMKQIAGLLESGDLHPHISSKFRFSDLPDAHRQIETGKTQGKIVVEI
jgi:NADPH:quinone reductase-like Zn-dependent oxidoreductase